MASGNFPIPGWDPEGKALKDAISQVKKARDGLSYDDGQFDNAADDGGYLALMDLAIELLERCVRG